MNGLNEINKKIGNYRWTICAILFIATTLNYLDRQVLSLLQPRLTEQFHWTNNDYANITAGFQLIYAFALLFAGRFIDRVGTKKGYAWALVVWSLACVIHAFSVGIGKAVSPVLSVIGIVLPVSVLGFMVSRFVLAVGESGNFPAAIKTVSEWFPQKERSLATGIFNSGANIGAILAPLTVPWIALHWGWQTAFVLVGIFAFIWLILWFIFYSSPRKMLVRGWLKQPELDYIEAVAETDTEPAEKESGVCPKVGWGRLLCYRQTWSFFFGKFLTDGVWWFFLFWLPAYLKAQYNVQGTDVMGPLAVLYTMTMVGSIGGGWFPAYFMNKGMQAYRARMKAMFIIALFPLVVLLAQPLGGLTMWIPIILIGVGASAHQAWSANIFTTVSDMFPSKAVASVTGIGGMAGGIGGFFITKSAGLLFDHYKMLGHIETGYTIMFSFCAIAYLLAWCIMKLLVPRFKPITDL